MTCGKLIPGKAGGDAPLYLCFLFLTQYIRATFDSGTGLLKNIENMEEKLSLPVKQGFFW